jgi:hypothetical protein
VASVTVTPEQFSYVQFDAARITAVAERLLDELGLDVDLTIEVDETTPLGRSRIESRDPLVLRCESGALEDPRHPRTLSEAGTAGVLGRLLLRERDRRDPAFGAPEADDELDLPHKVAWQVYAAARLARMGYRPQRQRWLYHLRNRLGFSDATDAAFDTLWTEEPLSWAEISDLVEGALAERQPAA